jgi:hypothetical protein
MKFVSPALFLAWPLPFAPLSVRVFLAGAFSSLRSFPALRGRDGRGGGLTGLHIQPRLAVGDVSVR